jgi:hypothetical protein
MQAELREQKQRQLHSSSSDDCTALAAEANEVTEVL